MRRRAPPSVTLAVCAVVLAAAAAPVRADPARVGLADATEGGRGGAAVAALRARLEPRRNLVLTHDAARAALEAPLPAEDAGAAAVVPTGDAALRPRAVQLLRAARDAYSRFDYDGALERVRQAELALAAASPGPELTRELVDLNLLVGVIHVDRGDLPRALDAFRAARRLDPARKALDPGSYRPRAVSLYAQAGAAPDARKSRLAVVTEPPGAEVWIDGQSAGTAPVSLALDPGPHYVSAVTEGSAPRLEKPVLRAGEDTRLSLLLSRLAPEERARQARAALAAGRTPWERGAAVLAVSASLDYLILVREGDGGVVQAALLDARAGTLGPWTAAAPVEPVLAALAVKLAPPARAPAPGLVTAGGPRDQSPPAVTPWYRSWWLVPPLLAVGAAAALGTLWMIDREKTTTYSLDRWCFGTTCSP